MAAVGGITGASFPDHDKWEFLLLRLGSEIFGAGYARVILDVSGFFELEAAAGETEAEGLVNLVNAVAVEGWTASGGDWLFDELVINKHDVSPEARAEFFRLKFASEVRVTDGNDFVIPIGEIRVDDLSLSQAG
jgi:hypothetical protein